MDAQSRKSIFRNNVVNWTQKYEEKDIFALLGRVHLYRRGLNKALPDRSE
jgi:hypothetical protein